MEKLTKTESDRLVFIKDIDKFTARDLMDAYDISKLSASATISTLLKKGVIKKIGKEGKGQRHLCIYAFNSKADYKDYERPAPKVYKDYEKPKHFDHVFNNAFKGATR